MSAALPTIKIDAFEGPFDLLLELARANKVDLTQVSLSAITDSYLSYLEQNRIASNLQADFVMVAATLLLLKLKRALPQLTDEEEEEISMLTDRIRLYHLYREQAQALKENWQTRVLLPGPERLSVNAGPVYPDCPPALLQQLYLQACRRKKIQPKPLRHIRPRRRSLQECIRLLTDRLQRVKRIWFHEAVGRSDNHSTAVSFLAILELARQQHVVLQQASLFKPIAIKRYDAASPKN